MTRPPVCKRSADLPVFDRLAAGLTVPGGQCRGTRLRVAENAGCEGLKSDRVTVERPPRRPCGFCRAGGVRHAAGISWIMTISMNWAEALAAQRDYDFCTVTESTSC